ncbi:MAG: SocA family protein [Synergistaceae bacterium]|jgi:uncharacterized phage-associated protein|nr:SocA family protein [Synergistaceae bacterium]
MDRSKFDFDMRKLESLIHYISYKADREKLSAVKLYKILWFSETTYYQSHKKPIVGETYVKGAHGPLSCHAKKAIENLKGQEKMVVSRVNYFNGHKMEYVPLINPDISCFSAEEISHVDGWIDAICMGTASGISEFSHNDIWAAADDGEALPYSAVFFAPPVPPSAESIAWARSIAFSENAQEEVC